MMKAKQLFLSAVALLLAIPGHSQGFLRASGQQIVNKRAEPVLLRGVGLGGWMLQEGYMLGLSGQGQQHKIRERIVQAVGPERADLFYARWLQNHTTKADIDSLKRWGFNSVRLPMHYALFTLPVEEEPVAGYQTWLEKGFMLTDSLLSWCKSNQMYLILDLHAAPGGQGHDLDISDRDPTRPSLWESQANRDKTIALWTRLAARYANEPWIGGYDILNEPNWGFSNPQGDKNGTAERNNGPLQQLLKDITMAIRKVDRTHLIILSGNGWGNNYNGIVPDWDSNMALSFHKYWNRNDDAAIAAMLQLRKQYNMPVWLGETGENSNVWFSEAVALFERNQVGWAWWPLKKLGNNNPLQIPSNPDYDRLLAFWNGQGPKPDAESAWRGLTQLAKDLRAGNNRVQHDVIDALRRQPATTATRPFKRHVLKEKLLIQAVDYDLGRNGFAYFDKDTADYHLSTGRNATGNRGRVYRNDGVDIAKGDGFYVNHIETGEWLAYSIHVAEAGSYKLVLRTRNPDKKGGISVAVNGMRLAGAQLEKSTGTGTSVTTIAGIELEPGLQRVVLFAEAGDFELFTLEFSK